MFVIALRHVHVPIASPDSVLYKKDVGVCTFAYPDSRPSHCLPPKISNVHSPRQDRYTEHHVARNV